MRVIIEFPSQWSAPQVIAILDLLELLHTGLRDHYELALRETLAENNNDHNESVHTQFNDDIPF